MFLSINVVAETTLCEATGPEAKKDGSTNFKVITQLARDTINTDNIVRLTPSANERLFPGDWLVMDELEEGAVNKMLHLPPGEAAEIVKWLTGYNLQEGTWPPPATPDIQLKIPPGQDSSRVVLKPTVAF